MQQRRLRLERQLWNLNFLAGRIFPPHLTAVDENLFAVEMNRAISALQSPRSTPRGSAPARGPVAAVAEWNFAVQLHQHLEPGVMLKPAPSRVERLRRHLANIFAGDVADQIEMMDRH